MSIFKNKSKSDLIGEIESLKKQVKELKRIEDTLQRSEEKFTKTFNSSPSPMIISEIDSGNVIDINKAFADMVMYSRQELIGKSVLKLNLWANPKDRDTYVKKMKDNKRVSNYEIELRTKSGDIRATLISGEILTINGKHYLLTTGTDITERKHSELELEKSEEKLRAIFDSAADAIVETDISGNILKVNKAVLRIYGSKSGKDFIGKSALEFYAKEDRTRALKAYRQTYYESIVEESEFTALKVDGTPFPVQITSSVLRDVDGKPIGFVGIIKDITERKLTEEKLIVSEQNYRGLFDNAIDAIYILDERGRFIAVNKGAVEMYGYPKEFFIGKTPKSISAPGKNDWIKINNHIKKALDGNPQQFEFWGVRSNGELFPKLIRLQKGSYYSKDAIIIFAIDITERKRAEDALRASEEQYQTLVRHTPAVLWTSDQNGRTSFISSNVEKVYGYTPEEIIRSGNRLWFGRIHSEDLENVKAAFAELMNKGKPYDIEYRIQRQDGDWIWLHDRATCSYEVDGTLRADGVFFDITERKRSERALKESEEKYKELFEAESDALFLIDNETGNIIESNMAAEKLYGYTKKELAKKKNTDLSAESDKTKMVTENTSPNKEDVVFIPLRYHKKRDGTHFPVEITGRFFKWKGKSVHIAAIRDITERKLAEDTLKKSEAKYRLLFDSIPDVITTINEKGTIISANNSVKRILGYEPSELLGKSVEILAPEELRSEQKENITKAMNKGFLESYETTRIAKDGTQIPVDITVFTNKDNAGNLLGISAILRDISERKKAEEALRESERKFREMADLLPQIVFETDLQGNLTFVNEQAYVKFGYSKEDVKRGFNIYKALIPEDKQRAQENLLKIINGKIAENSEYNLIKKDGSVFPALIYSSRILKNDKPIGLRGILVDITERKLSEEELKESEEKHRIISELSSDYFYSLVVKPSGNIEVEWLSESFERVTTYSRNEIENLEKWRSHIYPDDIPGLIKNTEALLENNVVTSIYRLVTTDGETRWFSDRLMPNWDEKQQKVIRIFGAVSDITERKLAEKALQESEERYRNVVENARELIWQVDTEGKFVFFNNYAEKLSGQKSADWKGKSFAPFVHPHDLARVNKILQDTLAGNTIQYETKIFNGKGEILDLEIQTIPTYVDAKVTGTLNFGRDITERKLAEETIRESQRQLSTLMSNLPGMAYKCKNDPNWTMEFISDGGYSLTGYHAQELVDSTKVSYSDLIHPEDRQMVWDKVQYAIEKKQSFQITYRIITASGENKWVWEKGQAIYGAENEVVSLEGFITDITEGKKAESKLRASRNQLRSLAERLQMIREEERATVAREIHDDLGQTLTALKMDISWMKKNPDMTKEKRVEKIDVMLGLTDSTIQTVKRIATKLRPDILDDLGLISAIEWEAEEFKKRSGIECKLVVSVDDIPIDENVTIAVFRIFQESLTNIARHSGATKVEVVIEEANDLLKMEIRDNGVGITEEQISSSKSLGLIGMNERVSVFGGKLNILKIAEGGTAVRVLIPIKKTR